jgi:uncharacterized Zn finger protein (UPF0148 family)
MPAAKCPKCGTQFSFQAGAESVACTGCGAKLRLKNGPASERSGGAQQPMRSPEWYYLDAQDQQQGPVDRDQIASLARSGAIASDTPVWKEGMAEWDNLAKTELAALLGPMGTPALPSRSKATGFGARSSATNGPSRTSTLHCPKCGSMQVTANKKGFGAGKSCLGWLLAGPFGILCGFCGSGKIVITCLQCGHQWLAGKH